MKKISSWFHREYASRHFSAINLGFFVVLFGCFGLYMMFKSFAASPPAPMPVISRGVPVYASSQQYPATNANDASYDTYWRSSGPAWIAYDLSSVPAIQRGAADVVWYGTCCSYDNLISGTGAYNLPGAYTIEANAAAGGGSSAPSSGWVTLATVSNNTYHSRQHMVNLAGYNWVRMNITAIDGSAGNTDAAINLEVRNASAGAQDDWIFYGDSITEGAMGQETSSNNIKSFQDLITAQVPGNFPVEENGGIGYQTTDSALTYIDNQLALFPGKYVGLSYGTNDANSGCGTSTCLNTFYNNYVQLVQKVLALGKIPMVPTIPWGCTGSLSTNVPLYNQQIQTLYTNFPQIVKGPDLYAYFNSNQSYISGNDCIHPNSNGMGLYRQQWATTILAAVYGGASDTTPPVISSVASSNLTSSGATITWATDENADSQVEYGTTTSYGSSTTLNSSLVTSHSVNLSGLTGGTVYHYRVKSKDASGNLATGSDNSFTTLPASSPGLHVTGNKLYDSNNNVVTLHGVNRAGTEYACIQGWGFFDGANVTNDDSQVPLIKSWKANSVNIGLNEDCWLNINGVATAYGGANYINTIKHEVATLEASGITPIISYFWGAPGTTQATGQGAMPDNDHAPAMWQSVANTFKNDPNVILRLKEEPYPAGNSDGASAWSCWKNGDVQYGSSGSLTPVSNNSSCSEGYSVVGMQSLINIIRGTGATNIIMVPGVEYANSMTHFLDSTYKVTDSLANPQLMAVVDVYPHDNVCGSTACYNNSYAPVIAAMPFDAGEIGEDVNGSISTMTDVDTLMSWLDGQGAGYQAWAWDAWGGTLQLIVDYTAGAAKSPWGVDYKNHLASLATVSLNAAPSTISSGSSATLTWSSTNASSCTASNGWSGSKSTSGSLSVSPAVTTTYTLTCNGTGNNAIASTMVTVNGSGSLPGDCNGDGHDSILDLSILLSNYGTAYSACDFNSDGNVNILDLSVLLSHYGS